MDLFFRNVNSRYVLSLGQVLKIKISFKKNSVMEYNFNKKGNIHML